MRQPPDLNVVFRLFFTLTPVVTIYTRYKKYFKRAPCNLVKKEFSLFLFGHLVILWYGDLAIFILVRWIILGFADINSKDEQKE